MYKDAYARDIDGGATDTAREEIEILCAWTRLTRPRADITFTRA